MDPSPDPPLEWEGAGLSMILKIEDMTVMWIRKLRISCMITW
jgi:hypothetical protein